MRHAIVLLLLLIAIFCIYGFVASSEPGANSVYFRIGYSLAGLQSAAAAAALLIGSRGKS